MAVLPIQDMPKNGSISSLTFTAATTADEFANDGKVIVIAKNDDASPTNISVTPTKDLGPLVTETATAIQVTNAEQGMFGPFAQDIFNAADGNVDITASSATSLSYAVVRLPRTP